MTVIRYGYLPRRFSNHTSYCRIVFPLRASKRCRCGEEIGKHHGMRTVSGTIPISVLVHRRTNASTLQNDRFGVSSRDNTFFDRRQHRSALTRCSGKLRHWISISDNLFWDTETDAEFVRAFRLSISFISAINSRTVLTMYNSALFS